MSVDVT